MREIDANMPKMVRDNPQDSEEMVQVARERWPVLTERLDALYILVLQLFTTALNTLQWYDIGV